jgi:hypothetical protein
VSADTVLPGAGYDPWGFRATPTWKATRSTGRIRPGSTSTPAAPAAAVPKPVHLPGPTAADAGAVGLCANAAVNDAAAAQSLLPRNPLLQSAVQHSRQQSA